MRAVRVALGFLTLAVAIVLFGAYAGLAIRQMYAHGGVSGLEAAHRIAFRPYSFSWDVHPLYYLSAVLAVLGVVMLRAYATLATLLGALFLAAYGSAVAGWAARSDASGSLAAPLRGVACAVKTGPVFLVMGLSALAFGAVLAGMRAPSRTAVRTSPRPPSGGGPSGPPDGKGPRPPKGPASTGPASMGLPNCPACGKAVLRGAKSCRHCGADLSTSAAEKKGEPSGGDVSDFAAFGETPASGTDAVGTDAVGPDPVGSDAPGSGRTADDILGSLGSDDADTPPPDALPPVPAATGIDDLPDLSSGPGEGEDSPASPPGDDDAEDAPPEQEEEIPSARPGSLVLAGQKSGNPASMLSPLLALGGIGCLAVIYLQGSVLSTARIGGLTYGGAWCGAWALLLGLSGMGGGRRRRPLAGFGALLGLLAAGASGAALLLGA